MKLFLLLSLLISSVALGFYSKNNRLINTTTVTSSAGTTTIPASGSNVYINTSGDRTYTLPDATNLEVGDWYQFGNGSAANTITVENQSNLSLSTVAASYDIVYILTNNGSADGTWHRRLISEERASGSGSGTTINEFVYLNTGNGHGSTATKIRRFSNLVDSAGNAITYTDSAANGADFEINEDGIYAIEYSDRRVGSSAAARYGLTFDEQIGTTGADSIGSVSVANGFIINALDDTNAQGSVVSYTARLIAGTTIRCHTDGNTDFSGEQVIFRITKIGN